MFDTRRRPSHMTKAVTMSVSTIQAPATDVGPTLRRLARIPFTSEPWRAAGFHITSFVVGLFWFVILVTLIATGLGLAITLVGIPILALAMLAWIGGARLERLRVHLFYRESIPDPYLPLPQDTLWRKGIALARDPAVWRDLLYMAMLSPIGVATFIVVVTFGFTALAFASVPAWYWAVPSGGPTINVGSDEFRIDTLPEALVSGLGGLVLLVIAAYVIVGLGRLHVALARWLLGPTERSRLAERVEVLTRTRSGVMEAALLERRRIERDLHDGAQQRIVALAMDLGMAREKRAADPDAAWELVEQAHDESKRALAELRELVQGIHPAILTDRGLDAAISAVAARSPVPVTVDVDLMRRLPEAVESTAYFVVVEALANVAKHAQATAANVAIRRDGDWLAIDVTDNGAGGADAARGTGLTGLRDRVAALDGRMTVVSPPGGGTRIRVGIPCAS
jgi:signal transduction histidine kinase